MNLNAENVCLMEIELQDEKQLVGLLTADAYKEFVKKASIEEVKKSPVEETHNLKVEDSKPMEAAPVTDEPLTLQKSVEHN